MSGQAGRNVKIKQDVEVKVKKSQSKVKTSPRGICIRAS